MKQVIALGHSRVPVYWGPAKSSITRFIHIKDQLMLTPADATPVASLRFHEPQWARPPRDRREIAARSPEIARDRPRSAEISFASMSPGGASLFCVTDGSYA